MTRLLLLLLLLRHVRCRLVGDRWPNEGGGTRAMVMARPRARARARPRAGDEAMPHSELVGNIRIA